MVTAAKKKRAGRPPPARTVTVPQVPAYVVALAEELRGRLGNPTLDAVLRAALVEGLRALERAHPAKRRRGG